MKRIFSRRHYCAIADALRRTRGVLGMDRVVAALDTMFTADNDRFDAAEFSAAVFRQHYATGDIDEHDHEI